MPLSIRKKKLRPAAPVKRRRGQPAHISRASIVKAAISFIEKDPNFSLYGLAKSLGVKPGTIHFHFPGAGAREQQLITEMVRTVLQPLAPVWPQT